MAEKQLETGTVTKSTFRSDIPVPDSVWHISVFVMVLGIFRELSRLSARTNHDAMKWFYVFSVLVLMALCVYAWAKINKCLSQRYESVALMNAEEKNELVEEQAKYFRYQLRSALLIGFWGTLLPVLLFYFFNAVDLPSVAVALIDPRLFLFCWSLVIWRAVMSIYYLRKLKQTQQPV